jgi:PPM family protein phosphatase
MVVQIMPYKVISVGASDVGLVRENNEDAWLKLSAQRFFSLADGMGGHQAGEIASNEAVASLCAILSKKLNNKDENIDLGIARDIIIESIQEVNKRIFQMSRKNQEFRGMGTTLCFLYFHPKGLIFGHVGDSRIYRLRDKKLAQLTKDHSLLRELLDLGQINKKQAEGFVYKNIITKAIGTEPNLEVGSSVLIGDISYQDLYLMCSDGLSDLISLEQIEKILNKKNSLKELSQELIETAKQHGGHDNITVVLVKVQEIHESKDPS